MTASDIQFKLRLPSALKDKLESAAEQAGRSLSNEIVRRLEDSFPAAIEFELIATRETEMERLADQLRLINGQIADLSLQLEQPSKRKQRAQIQEAIAALGRRQVEMNRIRSVMEIEIEKLRELAAAAEPSR